MHRLEEELKRKKLKLTDDFHFILGDINDNGNDVLSSEEVRVELSYVL